MNAHGQLIIAENALEVEVKDTLQVTLLWTYTIVEGDFLSSQVNQYKTGSKYHRLSVHFQPFLTFSGKEDSPRKTPAGCE